MPENSASEEKKVYDPNQMVELRTEWEGLKVPVGDSGEESAEATDAAGPRADVPGVLYADRHSSSVKICQETLRQGMLEALREFNNDITETNNFLQQVGGCIGKESSGEAGEKDSASFVSSTPEGGAVPTAGFKDLKKGIEGLGDRIQDMLSQLDIEVEYEKTDKGAKVRVRNRSEEATPNDAPAPDREPEVREVTRRIAGGGTVTVSVRPSGPAVATADGDTGSAANNNTIGYINKRSKGLIVNEFGQLYSVINLGLTMQFQFGVESD